MDLNFRKLNLNWNADPNAPYPSVQVEGNDILVQFRLNIWLFPEFTEDDIGTLRFVNCERFRLGATNDEGWYRGQCRFSKLAPEWGEFYSVTGDSELLEAPKDWKYLIPNSCSGKHYLFYFRDQTFECVAERCRIDQSYSNALYRKGKMLLNI